VTGLRAGDLLRVNYMCVEKSTQITARGADFSVVYESVIYQKLHCSEWALLCKSCSISVFLNQLV
jgi:hypothetical protein